MGNQCPTCDEILQSGLIVAQSILQHIEKSGSESKKIGDLKEVLQNQEKNQEELAIMKQLAGNGHQVAQMKLAEIYYNGNAEYGVEANPELAQQYFQQIADTNNGQALYNLGIMEIRNPKTANYSKAIQLFNRSAETNNGDGYSGLGYMYMNGFGIESNITAALEMFEKGAELGSLQSISNAGVLYLTGEKQNITKAIEYLLIAAKENQTNAIFDLVLLHIQGVNTTLECNILLNLLESMFQFSRFNKLLEKGFNLVQEEDFFGGYVYFKFAKLLGVSAQNANLMEMLLVLDICANDFCNLFLKFEGLIEEDPLTNLGDTIYELSLKNESKYQLGLELVKNIYRLESNYFPESIYSLSYLYENGISVQQSYEKAHKLNDKIIQRVFESKIDPVHLIPAYIQKINLLVQEYFF